MKETAWGITLPQAPFLSLAGGDHYSIPLLFLPFPISGLGRELGAALNTSSPASTLAIG